MYLPFCSYSPAIVRSAFAAAVLLAASIGSLAPAAAFSLSQPRAATAAPTGFGALPASAEARRVADWITSVGDNGGRPYIIVDKVNARLFLFDGGGSVRASVPTLIGAARGDDSAPGIGTRKLAAIRPTERTTPAGRFVAQLGHDSSGEDLLWVDYDTAIALHRASDRKPGMASQSRVDRLDSASIADNRASYGCIGVATAFYDGFIRPAFGAGGIVYVLPETRTATAEFGLPATAWSSAD